MKKSSILLGLALLCFNILIPKNSHSQTKVPSTFLINGEIKAVKDGTLIRLMAIDELKILDSAYAIDGKFVLKGHVNEPTACWLKCLDEYAIIEVENVTMKFNATVKQMKLNYIATGGREQTLQTELNRKLRPYEQIYLPLYDSLNNKLYKDTIDRKRMAKTFNTANDAYMNTYIAFGKRNINSYVGLDIVFRNRQKISKDSVMLLYNSLSTTLKKTSKANALKYYASAILAKKGEKFLDFNAVTIAGKPFKLSELKEKYIYLAFGSFSCGPCRMENKEISENYEQLSKSIHVVNFSLDVNKKEWELAAEQDGIIWPNVSDLAGMAGKIKTLYNVQSMPTSFLIDKNGIIIERFDGYNPENLQKIKKIAGL